MEELADSWYHAVKIDLKEGFSLIPVVDQLLYNIEELANAGDELIYPEFKLLNQSLDVFVKENSYRHPMAYFETEYFGGSGTQAAIAYQKGKVLKGPLHTTTAWDEEAAAYVHTPSGERAINRILYEIGLEKRNDMDGFDALGLGSYRSHRKMMESVGKGR